jgi:hypothetical protein
MLLYKSQVNFKVCHRIGYISVKYVWKLEDIAFSSYCHINVRKVMSLKIFHEYEWTPYYLMWYIFVSLNIITCMPSGYYISGKGRKLLNVTILYISKVNFINVSSITYYILFCIFVSTPLQIFYSNICLDCSLFLVLNRIKSDCHPIRCTHNCSMFMFQISCSYLSYYTYNSNWNNVDNTSLTIFKAI